MTQYVKPGVYKISAADARKLLAVSKTKPKAAQRLAAFNQKAAGLSMAEARLRKFDLESRLTP